MKIKIGDTPRLAVRLVNATTNQPQAGVTFNMVACAVEHADGSFSEVPMSGAIWNESTSGSFAGSGKYSVVLPAMTVAGPTSFIVKAVSCADYHSDFMVVPHSDEDTYENSRVLRAATLGKMVIDTGTKRMTLFDLDGTTIIGQFELQDETGVASVLRPFRRIPV